MTKQMSRKLIIAAASAISCVVLNSCSTTGDPTQGGIFWSPSKAKARQNTLLSAMTESQAKVDALEAKRSQLLNQKSSLQTQIRKLRTQAAQTTNPVEAAELNARISTLESQLENLSTI